MIITKISTCLYVLSVPFVVSKKVSYAHQVYIYLIKNSVKLSNWGNIISI